jgi:site-specific DNA-methyltransferase (adenine-specific)
MNELMNRLNLMDCMEGMGHFPDKYFDLAIVDPPYGIGEDGKSNHSRGCLAQTTKFIPKAWDRDKPDNKYFTELFRVSKNQIIWGGNYFIECLKNTKCMLVWDKDNGKTDFADCELAWCSFDKAVRKFKYKWQGMLQENMSAKEKRIHPTQKPVALYRWILQNYAKPGDKILDTHVGSGSSLIACIEEGFEYVGCELDKDYYEAASRRIQTHLEQGRLFTA